MQITIPINLELDQMMSTDLEEIRDEVCKELHFRDGTRENSVHILSPSNINSFKREVLSHLLERISAELARRGFSQIRVLDVKKLTDDQLSLQFTQYENEMMHRHLIANRSTKYTLASDLIPIDDAEKALCETDRKIQAIKHYRERCFNLSNMKNMPGLKDSKDLMDAYLASIGKSHHISVDELLYGRKLPKTPAEVRSEDEEFRKF